MFDKQDLDLNKLAQRCRTLGAVLFCATLFLPVGITDRHVDEFGSTLYGFECALGAVVSMFHFSPKFWSITLAAWVSPLTMLSSLIGRSARPSSYKILPYIFVLIVAGLVASGFALAHQAYRPLWGYYLWIASILMMTLPELYRLKRTSSPEER